MNMFLPYFRRGFISSWFLMIFLLVITICSNAMVNDQNRLKTLINHRKSQEYLLAESAVVNDILCRNTDGISEGTYSTETVSYELSEKENHLFAAILYPVQETMIIEVDEDGYIVDYEVLR